MRYTTLIDISEMPDIYRNPGTRLLYMHLALKAGYHDDDRDQVRLSLRQICGGSGLTLSAVRHALKQLERAKLVERQGDHLVIRKWFMEAPPTPRQTSKQGQEAPLVDRSNAGRRYSELKAQAAAQAAPADDQERLRQESQAQQAAWASAIRDSTRAELEEWLAELNKGIRRKHHGVLLNPSKACRDWLTKCIESK